MSFRISGPFDFIKSEVTTESSIKLDVDQNGNQKVYFGFGEWNSDYFEATNASGCPTIDFTNKDQVMNLYGGPCLAEKNTIQWAYSPIATDDINSQPITSEKGPMIVKSTFVSNDGGYIKTSSSGAIELYGAVIDDYRVANNVYQIVTSASAFGKNNTDLKYLGNETFSGEALLTNANNFAKTSYDFTNIALTAVNSNLC